MAQLIMLDRVARSAARLMDLVQLSGGSMAGRRERRKEEKGLSQPPCRGAKNPQKM